MATVLVCIALGCGSARGGHAIPIPPRGGHAVLVREPIGDLAAWSCIHHWEGAWNDATGNGYYGGLQFDDSFERSYGADMRRRYGGHANLWPAREQMVVAERARLSGRGYYPWPNTARHCGLI